MNDKGKPYSIDEISDKKNSLVIIYNHGSIQDTKQDPCKAKPQYGYIWDAAVVPAILKLHNKKINGLEVKIYRVCSGVKGMPVKIQKKYRKELKSKGKINLVDEHKIIKRPKIILNEVENLKKLGIIKKSTKKVKIFGEGKLLTKPTDENIKTSKGVTFG